MPTTMQKRRQRSSWRSDRRTSHQSATNGATIRQPDYWAHDGTHKHTMRGEDKSSSARLAVVMTTFTYLAMIVVPLSEIQN
jgi:hypothetical protein